MPIIPTRDVTIVTSQSPTGQPSSGLYFKTVLSTRPGYISSLFLILIVPSYFGNITLARSAEALETFVVSSIEIEGLIYNKFAECLVKRVWVRVLNFYQLTCEARFVA